jgi:hypothetical protein
MAKENVPSEGWEKYVNDLVAYVEKDAGFQARNTKITDGRKRRFCQQPVKIPEEYRKITSEFRSPFIFDILRRVPGLAATTLPTPKVRPYSDSMKAQEESSMREKWLEGSSIKMDRDCTTFFKIIDALGADGCGCWKIILDRHTWGKYGPKEEDESDGDYTKRVKEYHKANFPIYREHVVTETVYPLRDENGLAEVLQITVDSGAKLARKYNLSYTRGGEWVKGKNGDAIDPPMNAKFIEYWNREYFVYMVDDIVVKKGKHGYGEVPYFFASLGETSSPNIEDQYFGLGWPLEQMSDKFDSFMTMLYNNGAQTAYAIPTLVPINDMAVADENPPKIELVPGKLFTPPLGYRLEFLVPPSIGQDVVRILDFLKNEIDRIGLAPVLYGVMQGEQSHASQQTAISVAKSILSAGLKNICREFNREAKLRLRMVELLGEAVPVWEAQGDKRYALELEPKDVKGYYEVEHTLEPIIPAEQQTRYMFLADAQARGAITMEKLREDGLNISDPEAMELDVMVESAAKSSQYQNMLFTKWIQSFHPEEQGAYQPGAPQANLPVQPGGAGVPMGAGMGQGMMPEQRVATRPQGVGRG